MINFSIIIPHKNIPSLLERCILSIPQREDVQIIVVDDNSNEENIVKIRSFECSCKQANLSVAYLNGNQAKGAGRARNVGLEYAKGKWLIFADSDDTFETEALNSAFDLYANCEADIVFFGVNCFDSVTRKSMKNADECYLEHLHSKIDAENKCRYKIQAPWGKFVKRDLIIKNDIKFDETKVGNDAWFSLQVGYRAEKVVLDYTPIYNWIIRSNSITSIRSEEAVMTHFMLLNRLNKFKEAHNLSKYRLTIFAFMPMLVRAKMPVYKAFVLCVKYTSYKYILKDIASAVEMALVRKICSRDVR